MVRYVDRVVTKEVPVVQVVERVSEYLATRRDHERALRFPRAIGNAEFAESHAALRSSGDLGRVVIRVVTLSGCSPSSAVSKG